MYFILCMAVKIIYMDSIHNMKKIIASITSFSVEPIGPLSEHAISELFIRLILASFANSYFVNTYEHLRNLAFHCS